MFQNLRYRWLIPLGSAVLLLGLLAALSAKTITIRVDGQEIRRTVFAFTSTAAAWQAGIPLTSLDKIDPPESVWLRSGDTVVITRARQITLYLLPEGKILPLASAGQTPLEIMQDAGLEVDPDARFWWNGKRVAGDERLPSARTGFLQIRLSQPVVLSAGGETRNFQSSALNILGALSDQNIPVRGSDQVEPPLSTALEGPTGITLRQARPITVFLGDREMVIFSAAQKVGEALLDGGLTLQGLDYSQPPEDADIPADGKIRLVRVREEILDQQIVIPYGSSLQADPNTELDQKSVLVSGEPGLKISRVRVRYEDGQEVSRESEAEWVARQPKDQVLGYGTKVVIHTLDTPNGPIQYYRAVTMYATSYSPCNLGIPGKCSNTTASGAPVGRGIAAFTLPWYRLFKGTQVYVPGYGTATIADVGGGVPGKYWIDLAYTDADYVEWHQNVTVYFLTPVPENIPWPLP